MTHPRTIRRRDWFWLAVAVALFLNAGIKTGYCMLTDRWPEATFWLILLHSSTVFMLWDLFDIAHRIKQSRTR